MSQSRPEIVPPAFCARASILQVPILCIDPFTGDTNMWASYQTDRSVAGWVSLGFFRQLCARPIRGRPPGQVRQVILLFVLSSLLKLLSFSLISVFDTCHMSLKKLHERADMYQHWTARKGPAPVRLVYIYIYILRPYQWLGTANVVRFREVGPSGPKWASTLRHVHGSEGS